MKKKFLILHSSSSMPLIQMLSDLKFNNRIYDKIVILWSGYNAFPKEIMSALKINYEFISINNIKGYNLQSLKKYNELLKLISKFINDQFEYFLYTHFIDDLTFQLIKKKLNIKKENIYLFSDGFETYLLKKRKIKEYLKTFFHMMLFNIRFNRSKYLSSFSDDIINLKVIAPELLQKKKHKKKIYNLNKSFYKGCYSISKKIDLSTISENSALLLTTHSLESNRISMSSYNDLITKIICKLEQLGIENIYFKMHHGENFNLKRQYYKSLGLLELNSYYSAEIYLMCSKFVVLAHPYSSTILISYGLGNYNNLRSIISYRTPERQNSNIKENLSSNIIRKMKVEHIQL